MVLKFYGAAKEVTGSCHCIEINGKKLLVDAGLQQGEDEKDNQSFPFNPGEIDYVVLTHAHIDHSGRLPLLVKQGFKGKIFATKATCDLVSIMLRDSAHIQEMDAQWKNQKGKRAGAEPEEPLYTVADAENTLQYLVPCSYEQDFDIAEGIKARFTDAGHLLGSASVKFWFHEANSDRSVVFSGDIGNMNQPIIKDPQYLKEADYVVMESTYGDRCHEAEEDHVTMLAGIIDETLSRGGNVVIPSFAVGRTQELLYFIQDIKQRKLVKSDPDFPVYVDSPLASEATKIYDSDMLGYGDDEALSKIRNGQNPLKFPNLNLCNTSEESKLLNEEPTPKVIISSSGMCEAGRIRHHLKHNLWRSECSVIFVGYQANGTLGRILLDGAKKVKLFGEEIAVKAHIYKFGGLSAHADKNGLLKWIEAFEKKPRQVFVVHGEEGTCDEFVSSLRELGFSADAPNYDAVYDLAAGSFISQGVPAQQLGKRAEKKSAASAAFARLLNAGEHLLSVIRHNEGGANKDLARFTDQVNSLIEKWDR